MAIPAALDDAMEAFEEMTVGGMEPGSIEVIGAVPLGLGLVEVEPAFGASSGLWGTGSGHLSRPPSPPRRDSFSMPMNHQPLSMDSVFADANPWVGRSRSGSPAPGATSPSPERDILSPVSPQAFAQHTHSLSLSSLDSGTSSSPIQPASPTSFAGSVFAAQQQTSHGLLGVTLPPSSPSLIVPSMTGSSGMSQGSAPSSPGERDVKRRISFVTICECPLTFFALGDC